VGSFGMRPQSEGVHLSTLKQQVRDESGAAVIPRTIAVGEDPGPRHPEAKDPPLPERWIRMDLVADAGHPR
jgi:hypothetical protein